MNPHIRWMTHRDHSEVLTIDRLGFDQPWDEGRLIGTLRRRTVIGLVAETNFFQLDAPVLAFMLYKLHRDRLKVLRLAVHPDARRMGIGRALLDKLVGKLSSDRRTAVTLTVPDTNLAAHQWLRACGFRAEGVDPARDRHLPGSADLYRFAYRLPLEVGSREGAASNPWFGPYHPDWREQAIASVIDLLPSEAFLNVIRQARPVIRALPKPVARKDSEGRSSLTWVGDRQLVRLQTDEDSRPSITVHPGPFPPFVREGVSTAECLARALDWLYLATPEQVADRETEDRQC